eukprot:TRINITY_DN81810_c0_g1_i1.p1 TRINITY_DN81810_c0_g1~~TRINITY_DN81810_c0_g1_i1.p1  ORF type:complete len:258 (-),score=62.73 TRINITY_DN81810_c0_g1_i1:177-890(-)
MAEGSEQIAKAQASKAEAEAKSAGLGTVNTSGGFGAGAGGGFGLNAPGVFIKPKEPQAAKGSTINVDEAVALAWSKVMDDNDPTGWVLVKYTENGKAMELDNAGEGGLTPFKAALPEDRLAWGAFRCAAVDKRGGVECKRPKMIFVQYQCESASQIKKAKMGSHKGDVKNALNGCHMDIVIEKPDDLVEQDLVTRLQAATGAHKPNGYEFDDGNFIEADYYGLGIGSDCKGETAKSS